jgi:hypothetical protein
MQMQVQMHVQGTRICATQNSNENGCVSCVARVIIGNQFVPEEETPGR